MSTSMWRVEGKGFCVGLYMVNDRIDHAGPALAWTVGKTRQWLNSFAPRAGWIIAEAELVSVPDRYRR